MLIVSFVSNVVLIVWVNSNWQNDITFIGRQSMRLDFCNIGVADPILAHAQMNYHVSQFRHLIK